MKKTQSLFHILFIVSLIFSSASFADETHEDIIAHPSCPLCGMDRAKFAHSRVLIIYEDESETGFCSLHCAALDMAGHLNSAPRYILAGDYISKDVINAEKAYWVIGGKKPGVMTRRAKWAFKKKPDAQKFIRKHGGKLANFENSLKAAYADMYEDTRMIREKRKKKRQKGAGQKNTLLPPKPGPDVKCPVCGMFVAKYPNWVGMIHFKGDKYLYFDGAKDLFKCLQNMKKYAPKFTKGRYSRRLFYGIL